MRGFGGGRRAQGARPQKGARSIPSRRSPDAALGRETRNLLGPAKTGRLRGARRQGPAQPWLPSLPALRGRSERRRLGLQRPLLGRLVTPARAGGLLGMLAAGFLLTFVTGPSAFALTGTDIPKLEWTSEAELRAALALPDGANVFELDTRPLEAAIEALPAIDAADVAVRLPDGVLAVTVREREAILAWQSGPARYLADREGVLFASIEADAQLPPGMPVVDDRRAGARDHIGVGARIDAVDLDVATRLASLVPNDVGSAASRLRVRITDTDGFVVAVEEGWTAVFGFYSPATRSTGMIPGQVRLLRSILLEQGEDKVARVVLASETDGTYVPKATPKPTKG